MCNGFRCICRHLSIVGAIWAISALGGCQKAVVDEQDISPVFYPAPPGQPKLQFLTSYEDGSQFDMEKPSFLESFVLGEPEMKVGEIVQPYGVAMHKGKLYVCDLGHRNIKVMDVVNNTFTVFPSGRAINRPVNIFIEPDGTKYVADSGGGVVSVWNKDDKVIRYLGKELGIKPIDAVARGEHVYVSDTNSNQVLVLDKKSGELIKRIGREVADRAEWGEDEFYMITDMALDGEGKLYVSDKLKGKVTVFDAEGKFSRTYGKYGSSPASLARAKGVAVDREGRVWVVDAGIGTVVKVFRKDGALLMLFGYHGTDRGRMYLPADIHIDYDHVDLFKQYAVPDVEIEFLVFVTNQFGPHKVSVYGFGEFPEKYSQPIVEDVDESEDSETAGSSKEKDE